MNVLIKHSLFLEILKHNSANIQMFMKRYTLFLEKREKKGQEKRQKKGK